MEKNLTTGSVFKNIAVFSLPFLLSYFLQTLYGMADLYIIGQFEGVASTTAVSIGSQVMHMLTVMIVGLAMGTTVAVGRSVGANDKNKVSVSIGNTVTLFMSLSVVLSVVLYACVKPIVGIVSTPADAFSGTEAYLKVCFVGIPFITAYNIIGSIFRGLGDSKSPMYFIAVACVANIALDYLFMGAMHMGPVGAALGTTLSQAVSVITAVAAISIKKLGVTVSKKHFKPEKETMFALLRTGIPIALQDGLIQIAFLIITVIANKRGLDDAAAVGIVEKIISFIFLVPSSMLSAVSALCSQNIGAGKKERAVLTLKYAILITTVFGIAVCTAVSFCADGIVSLFTDAASADGANVVRLGGQYLRGYIFDCIFAGIHFSFSGYFCACGKSEISFIHNVISVFLVRVPLVYFMSKMFSDSLFPMGLATATGSLLSVIICIIAFLIISRKDKESVQ